MCFCFLHHHPSLLLKSHSLVLAKTCTIRHDKELLYSSAYLWLVCKRHWKSTTILPIRQKKQCVCLDSGRLLLECRREWSLSQSWSAQKSRWCWLKYLYCWPVIEETFLLYLLFSVYVEPTDLERKRILLLVWQLHIKIQTKGWQKWLFLFVFAVWVPPQAHNRFYFREARTIASWYS